MERKTAIILATAALFCVIGIAFAAEWYFSEPQNTVIVDTNYYIYMDQIPATMQKYTFHDITGDVTLSGSAVPGITVYLYINGTESTFNALTDEFGNFDISYWADGDPGTTLSLQVGIYQ